jgi:anti-sigma-K factor RskA
MSDQARSAGQMVKIFKDEPSLMARLKADIDPLPVLEEAAKKAEQQTAPWTGDKMLYRVAVVVLSALTIIAAIGSIGLVAAGKTTPEVLVALGSAAVGALVGLFAPAPSGK